MSKQIAELQTVLAQLVTEHQRLLTQMDAQHAAMKKMDIPVMTELVHTQEATRLRITGMDSRRKMLSRQLAMAMKVPGEPTLRQLAELYPQSAPMLHKARLELQEIVGRVARRTQSSSRLSNAVLGHLNTVLRLVASAVERAGVYTRQGVPRMASRIGSMDAVG